MLSWYSLQITLTAFTSASGLAFSHGSSMSSGNNWWVIRFGFLAVIIKVSVALCIFQD